MHACDLKVAVSYSTQETILSVNKRSVCDQNGATYWLPLSTACAKAVKIFAQLCSLLLNTLFPETGQLNIHYANYVFSCDLCVPYLIPSS